MDEKTHCHEATVRKIEGDYVYVLMQIDSACAACHAKSFCIPSQTKKELLKIKNSGNLALSEGETIVVEMEKKLGGKALRIGYLYPFVVLITLVMLIYQLTSSEVFATLSSFCGVALYYFFMYLFNKKKKIDQMFAFRIKKQDV